MFMFLAIVIFVACVAHAYLEGLASAAATLFVAVLSGLLATNLFEWAAGAFTGIMPNGAPFAALWILFMFFAIVGRTAFDFLAPVRIRFHSIAEMIGSVAFGLLLGWTMLCFTTASLHVAPLARTAFAGDFMPNAEVETRLLGVAPDRAWLGFVYRLSQGSLAPATQQEARRNELESFIYRYAARRQAIYEEAKKELNAPKR